MIWTQLLAIQAPGTASGTGMSGGLLALLMGLAVIVVGLICYIIVKNRGSSKGQRMEAPTVEPVAQSASAQGAEEDPILIALIGAALAAYDSNPNARLVVRSVRRVGGALTPWQKSAREEAMAR